MQVREGRLLQRSKEELRTSKLPQNQKIRIITILHQFRDKHARELVTVRHEGFYEDPRWVEKMPAKEPLKQWIAERLLDSNR